MRTPALLGCMVVLASCGGAHHGAPAPRAFDAGERSAWVEPARWGLDGHLEPPVDRAELGPRTLYLAFREVPRAERALLVLTPLGRGAAVLVVERTADGVELARTPIDGARPVRIELPGADRHELAIHAEGAITIASPLHVDARARPRLELTLSAPVPLSTGDAR